VPAVLVEPLIPTEQPQLVPKADQPQPAPQPLILPPTPEEQYQAHLTMMAQQRMLERQARQAHFNRLVGVA
jgi:hypothetical protein